MKLLLDENMPHNFRLPLEAAGHEVATAQHMNWDGIRNGRLLRLAADEGFEALLTLDRGMEDQHNPATLPLAIVILRLPRGGKKERARILAPLIAALEVLPAKNFTFVEV